MLTADVDARKAVEDEDGWEGIELVWVVDADEGSSAVSLRGTLCFLRAYIAAVLIEQCQMGKRQSDTAHWYGVEWTLDLTELRELDGGIGRAHV